MVEVNFSKSYNIDFYGGRGYKRAKKQFSDETEKQVFLAKLKNGDEEIITELENESIFVIESYSVKEIISVGDWIEAGG